MKKALAAAMLSGILLFTLTTAASGTGDKVTICHAAGQDGTLKYIELTLSENAVYKEQGGHFFENGTPRAGHEDDYIGECEGPHETTTTVDDTTTTVDDTTTTTEEGTTTTVGEETTTTTVEETTTTTEPEQTTTTTAPDSPTTTTPDEVNPPNRNRTGATPVLGDPGYTG